MGWQQHKIDHKFPLRNDILIYKSDLREKTR